MTPSVYFANYMWNLDASVGKGGANSNECDITYIQWYYTLAAAHPLTPEERKADYRKVSITGKCSGQDSDPLVQAIYAHQRHLRHPEIDGRISVARGEGKVGSTAFFVYRLGCRFADMYPNLWPRLDWIPGCPPSVASAVRNAVPKLPNA
jgi:hypothetical protein